MQIDNDYPFILNKLLKFIIKIKESDKEISIIDIIMDFSLKKGYELELLGDVISTDVQLKDAIEYDLQKHNYTEKNISFDW